MATATETKSTGTVESDDSNGGTEPWSVTSASLPASSGTESDTTDTEYLRCNNFGFSLPGASALLTGITVKITRYGTYGDEESDAVNDATVQLVNDSGTNVGTNKADTSTVWPESSAIATYGGSSDTWSSGLSISQLKSTNFGVVIDVDLEGTEVSADAEITAVQIIVDYSYTVSNTKPFIYLLCRLMILIGIQPILHATEKREILF